MFAGNHIFCVGDICPAGSYCPPGAGAPTPCPPGTYLPTTNGADESDCLECEPGTFCGGRGNLEPTGKWLTCRLKIIYF